MTTSRTPSDSQRREVLCPTCRGKGRIPDPTIGSGVTMGYYDPQTGDRWPHVTCRTCGGSGWVNDR